MRKRPFQLLELCRKLPEGQWTWQPHPRVKSARAVLVHMMEAEQFWVGHVVGGGPRPNRDPREFASPDALEAVWRPLRAGTAEWRLAMLGTEVPDLDII